MNQNEDPEAREDKSPFQEQSDRIFNHVKLHAELWRLEWKIEKQRLNNIALYSIIGIATGASLVLFTSLFFLAMSWGTVYCIPTFLFISFLYFSMFVFAWFKINSHIAQSSTSFTATRQQLSEDIQLCKEFLL
jgi:uncharacterized membrane protein YqjE